MMGTDAVRNKKKKLSASLRLLLSSSRSFHLREHDTVALQPCLDQGIVE
jgi:hypothetical protein